MATVGSRAQRYSAMRHYERFHNSVGERRFFNLCRDIMDGEGNAVCKVALHLSLSVVPRAHDNNDICPSSVLLKNRSFPIYIDQAPSRDIMVKSSFVFVRCTARLTENEVRGQNCSGWKLKLLSGRN